MWAPMFTTSFAPKLLALIADDKKKVALPGAWLGLSALIVIIAFLNLSLAPIGRRIDHSRAVDTGGARLAGWLAATLSVVSLGIFGAAFAATAEAAELLVAFGLVPWAKFGAWAGVLAGLMGLVTIITVLRAKLESPLPLGTWLGLLVTGVGALGFGLFLLFWGLAPF
jgi:hypothetical protein